MKETVQKWIIKADNDLKTARLGLNAPEPITDTVCFHCQQAAEKYLKLFLFTRMKSPDKTHNISALLQQCAAIEPSFLELGGIEYLTDYAVTLRYPDDFFIPSEEEAAEALQLAEKVKAFVLARLEP